MSVTVHLRGPSGPWSSVEFDRPTFHTMAEGPAETAEQFAKELEDIAAVIRRMYPKPAEGEA